MMKLKIFRIGPSLLLAASIFAYCATDSHASKLPVDWSAIPYRYVVVDQDIRALFSEFSRVLAVPMRLSDAVRGRLKGPVSAQTAAQFLDVVTQEAGLTWFFDGSILHVSANAETSTELIARPQVTDRELERQLRDFGLSAEQFDVATVAGNRAMRLSGPPAFIALARQAISLIQAPPLKVAQSNIVSVYRGNSPVETVSVEMTGTSRRISSPSIVYRTSKNN